MLRPRPVVVRQRGFRCLAKHWQVPASPATTVPGTPITPKESDDLVKKLQAENARLRELKTPTSGTPRSSPAGSDSKPKAAPRKPAPIDDTVKEISSAEEEEDGVSNSLHACVYRMQRRRSRKMSRDASIAMASSCPKRRLSRGSAAIRQPRSQAKFPAARRCRQCFEIWIRGSS